MRIYTVCGEFVREACVDTYYALNVLYEFIKDNDKRIAVDRKNRAILKDYAEICKENRSQHMSFWIKQLALNQNRNIELISVDVEGARNLYLEVANKAPNPRKMLIWSVDHYRDQDGKSEVIFLDREAAKREFIGDNNNIEAPGGADHMKNIKITAGAGTNIIIGSQLSDSMKYLQANVSGEAAKTLKDIAQCVEASGSTEAGAVFDKLTAELNGPQKSKETIGSFVTKLFEYIPDMARIGKSVQEVVEVLSG